MKRIFHPYWKWEDHKAGLYELTYAPDEEEYGAVLAKTILCNSEWFKMVASKMVAEWVKSAEFNLTNTSRNRQAWIGQASCCYALGVPDYVTKIGWRMMTNEQQREANKIADQVIEEWEKKQKCQKTTCLNLFC
jgi:hypothetical protein